MEVLTKLVPFKDGYKAALKEKPCCCENCDIETCALKQPCEVEQEALDRLAQYEMTWVEPWQISDHQKEIYEAEIAGRLVILPEECEDIDWFHFLRLIVLESHGRLIEIPDVSERDQESIRDSLYDYLQEWIDDPSVGLHGPNEGEQAVMQALIDGLLLKEGKDADKELHH